MMAKTAIMFLMLTLACPLWADDLPAEKFVYDDHGKRDPFWKLVTASGSIMNFETDLLISDLTLEGIIVDPRGANLAIINGNVVKTNDKLGAFTVLKIEKDNVKLLKGQESFILRLKREE